VPPKKKAAEKKSGYLKIKQIGSGVGRPETHKKTLRALGLRHQHTVVQPDNEAIRGMLFQVRHLVEVSEAEGKGN
jgi:large subunit ribosomal protein L30